MGSVLVLAALSSLNTEILDTSRMITEHLWEQEFIPESSQPVTPLSEYSQFEISELFRAETIADMERAISAGYPMPWLEEILNNEAIPWKDRYWLDRRIRSAIALCTHTFFNNQGDPVHIEADDIFPGEMYWRENLIVDPPGMFAPQGIDRPAGLETWDIGFVYNLYGRKIGEIAAAIPRAVFSSRDASTSILVSGGNSVYTPSEQPFACFMRLDGSFTEVPLSNIGVYHVALSANGENAVFSLHRTHDRELHTYCGDDIERDIEIFDAQGNLLRYIDSPVNLDSNIHCFVQITEDGRYLCQWGEGVAICLIDCSNGEVRILPDPEGIWYTDYYLFSPDGRFLALSGRTEERIYNIEDQTSSMLQPEIQRESGSYGSRVFSSSNALFASVTRFRPESSMSIILFNDTPIDSVFLFDSGSISEFSPNSFFVITNHMDPFASHPYIESDNPDEEFIPPIIVSEIRGVE